MSSALSKANFCPFFLFPPKEIRSCCAGVASVRDGSGPSSPPGPGPADTARGTALSTAARRTAMRSVPPQPRPRPPPAAIPAPLSSPQRPHPEHSPYLPPARLPSPVPVPAPTPTPERGSDGTAPLWGRPRKGGAVPNRAGPIPDGGSAPSPALATGLYRNPGRALRAVSIFRFWRQVLLNLSLPGPAAGSRGNVSLVKKGSAEEALNAASARAAPPRPAAVEASGGSERREQRKGGRTAAHMAPNLPPRINQH